MSMHPSRTAVVLLALASGAACSSPEAPGALRGVAGVAVFSLTGFDAALASLEYSVENAGGDRVKTGVLEGAALEAIQLELQLPRGADYALSVNARTTDGLSCIGSRRFDVSVAQRSEVSVELACSGAPVSVVGTLVPETACPEVTITTPATTLEVGASLSLEASADGALAADPTWSASAGELSVTDAGARFTCTEPGVVQLELRAGDGACNASDSVTVTCAAAEAPACAGLGSACHVVAETSEAAHECHELGHGGDELACAEFRSACVDTCGAALCTELAALCHDVDPGEGPLHECHELAHAADAGACFERGRECFDRCTSAHQEPVSVRFTARVGVAPFACGTTYPGVGSGGDSAEPRDFRFFVHDVRLVDEGGNQVPVELDERAPWQARGVALLDFEDGSGGCLEGDAALNATVTGRALPGVYTGLAFRIGVPEAVNHDDPAQQPAPLSAGTMSWGWLSGYKFMRAELGTAGGGGVLHLGAAGCSGDATLGSVSCARSNVRDVVLSGYDPATSSVSADIGALFAGVDVASAGPCHSSGEACAAPFASLGLGLAGGQNAGEQSVFSVAP